MGNEIREGIKQKPKGNVERKKEKMLEVLISFSRESLFLLSRIVGDPTVGFLRDKKGSFSTRRGQRVGTGFGSF